MMAEPAGADPRRGIAPLLVIGAVLSVQLGAAAATTLFDEIGPTGTVFYRLLFAAIVLVAVWRPDPRGATPRALALAATFGVTLAAMNLSFYEAIDRIPLGLAWVALAAAGIILLTGPEGSAEAAGIALALTAGGFWALYILLSARIGRAFSGGDGLALAMVVSAALLVGPGIAAGGGDLLDARVIAIGAAVAMLSSAIPY